MKHLRLIAVGVIAVVLSIVASLVFFGEKRQQSQAARVIPSSTTTAMAANEADEAAGDSTRTVSAERVNLKAKSSSSATQSKTQVSNGEVGSKNRTEALAAKEGPSADEVRQIVAQTYDKMLLTDARKVLQTPYAAAHSTVEKEPIDEAWAPAANQSIADAYSDFGSRVDVSMINCRTDICEVRINSLPGGDWHADLADVQDRLDAIKQQPWYQAQFDDASFGMSIADGPAGRLPVYVIFLTRK